MIPKAAKKNMYDAIHSNPELYHFFVSYTPAENTGYMFSTVDKYVLYSDMLQELVSDDCHSGASFAVCLREVVMQLKNERKKSWETL